MFSLDDFIDGLLIGSGAIGEAGGGCCTWDIVVNVLACNIECSFLAPLSCCGGV